MLLKKKEIISIIEIRLYKKLRTIMLFEKENKHRIT